MAKKWLVPATEQDRVAKGGKIEGGQSFEEAASAGDGVLRVQGAGSSDTLTVPGIGSLGGPGETTVNHADWHVTGAEFTAMKNGCSGDPGECAGEVSCTSGSELLMNDVNHYAAV